MEPVAVPLCTVGNLVLMSASEVIFSQIALESSSLTLFLRYRHTFMNRQLRDLEDLEVFFDVTSRYTVSAEGGVTYGPPYYRLSQIEAFLAMMYSMICVEWVVDHFALGMTYIDPLLTKICTKYELYIFVSSNLNLGVTYRPQICSASTCPVLLLNQVSSFYGFTVSRKLDALDRWTDRQTGHNS